MQVISVISVFALISQVSAFKCNDLIKCIESDFMTSTCVKNVCQCVDGYVPSNEGCIEKPSAPNVTLSAANNDEAIEGATIGLTCQSDLADPGLTYKWWEGDTLVEKLTTKTAYFHITSPDRSFKCAVVLGGVAESDPSEEQIIKVLPKTGGTSSAKPVLTLPSPQIAPNAEYTPVCTGYPYGLDPSTDVKLTDENGDELQTPIKQPFIVRGKKIVCTFEKTGINFTENTEIPFPQLLAKIRSVTVVPALPKAAFFDLADAPNLTCQVFPEEQYLLLGSKIKYTWSVEGVTGKEWQVPQEKQIYYDVNCTAGMNLDEGITSEPASTIVIGYDALPKPDVIDQPRKAAKTSQVRLTCARDDGEGDVEFSWYKNGELIPGQRDQTIQLGDLTESDNGEYVCAISTGPYVSVDSYVTKFTVQDQLAKPTVDGPSVVKNGETLNITCQSESDVPAMQYLWEKDGKAIDGATNPMYVVNKAVKTNSGTYKCTTKFGKLPPATSNELKVKVKDSAVGMAASLVLVMLSTFVTRLM